MQPLKILLVEDNDLIASQLEQVVTRTKSVSLDFHRASMLSQALDRVTKQTYDAILLDLSLSGNEGMRSLTELHEKAKSVPIVILSSQDQEALAVNALQDAAQDYLLKSQVDADCLVRTIRHAIESQRMREEIDRMRLVERHVTYHDSLTDLPNRQLFYDRLQHALMDAKRHQQVVGALFLDLDGFKRVNDTLGHSAGDRLLQSVAKRLKACIRESDTVARLGGDEFAVILTHIEHAQDVARVARKLLYVIAAPYVVEGHELYITASIGVSLFPSDGLDIETLVKNADIAMYRAKEHGKNHYQLFNLSMNEKAFERLILESSLRRALENGELVTHYQPQIDLASGEITGAEALVRWQHPELGLVQPAKFIPVAEETGLIVPLGEWVLRTACTQNKQWQDSGLRPILMNVNLSPRQFHEQRLTHMVERTLRETGLGPQYLGLEITESSAMQDANYTIAALKELKSMGVQFSVDDFGTGYSSLSYLKRFPIDTLKIDRSFIRDVCTSEDDAAITRAIVAMAHSLQLRVTAEGVETPDQLRFLQELDCDEMQGFHASRPVPDKQMEALLRSEKKLI